jgi:hypothetical protein
VIGRPQQRLQFRLECESLDLDIELGDRNVVPYVRGLSRAENRGGVRVGGHLVTGLPGQQPANRG